MQSQKELKLRNELSGINEERRDLCPRGRFSELPWRTHQIYMGKLRLITIALTAGAPTKILASINRQTGTYLSFSQRERERERVYDER